MIAKCSNKQLIYDAYASGPSLVYDHAYWQVGGDW